MTFTRSELQLLKEALAMAASRKESLARANPRAARKHDDKARDMRRLRVKICAVRTPMPPLLADVG